jgi:hypothetical protein
MWAASAKTSKNALIAFSNAERRCRIGALVEVSTGAQWVCE